MDPLVRCPFELSHSCKQSRLQKHLIKCRKNHPESKLEPCPYNATEYIHPDNLLEHLKVCKNAKLLEGQKYIAELHRENYLDAPFHMPKRKVEEDFEGKEVSVNDTDERVLERSVSQMSLNSIGSSHSLGDNDNEISNSKSLETRASNELPSRASSLRGVGRGHAMARLISVMHQMDGMDYSKYEFRSTVTDNKSQSVDPEFAHPSKFNLVQRGSVSGSENKQEQDKSKFEDSSSDEELEACDNVSICSSQSTIIENNRQSWAATPEPGKVIPLYDDSDDDETHISDAKADYSAVRFNRTSPHENISVNCISVVRDESPDKVSDDRDTSSSCSFYSLIRENLIQNEYIVRGMDRDHGRVTNFARGRPGYHNQNGSFSNHGTTFKPRGGPSSSGVGRGALLNAFHSSAAQSNYTNSRGQPHHFNQNGYQSSLHQGQRPHSNYNNQGSHSNGNQKNYQNFNQDQHPQRSYSNQSNQGSYSNRNHNGYQNSNVDQNPQRLYSNQSNQGSYSNRNQNGNQNSLNQDQYPQRPYSSQSNQGNFSNQNRGRGSAHEANSIGRGAHNRNNSFGASDSYLYNSIGRGNASDRPNPIRFGDASHQDSSVGRGKFLSQSSSRGSFNQENSFSRGNYRNKDNSVHKGNPHNPEQPLGRGSLRNQENSCNRQGFSNQESSYGRGQVCPVGRGSHNQENVAFSQVKPFGRGCLASCGSTEGQASPIGRGHMLAKLGVFSDCRNNESIGRGRLMTASDCGNEDNFRGKSSEFSHPSFEAGYNSFKDLQILDYSPTSQDLNFQDPKLINQLEAQGPFVQVSSGGGAPLPNSSSSFSQPKEPSANPAAPKSNKSKTKKKKKKLTSLKPTPVDSSAKSDTENRAQTSDASNIKILDKSMDPKKYFGVDGDTAANSDQGNNKANSNRDNPVTNSDQDIIEASSKENISEGNVKQNGNKVKSKQVKKKKKAKPKQDSSIGTLEQDNSNSDLKVNGNVSQSASKPSNTKPSFNNKVAATNRRNKFQVYDQFYSSMSYGPLNGQVNLNYDPRNQNQFIYQGSSAQFGRFSERIEDERQQANPRKAYASVNFSGVSGKPVEPASAGNIPSSASSVPQNVAFSSLHQPQRPQVPGRYDKLSGPGYKFQIRRVIKKQKVLSHKPKIVSHGKKQHNPPTASVNEPHASSAKKLYNPSSISNVSQGIKSSNQTVKVNQPSVSNDKIANDIAQKTGVSSCNAGIKSKQRKSVLNAKVDNANGPLKTKVLHSQVRSNGFAKKSGKSEMSLWNKKSYSKINPGNESSRSLKPHMRQWTFETRDMSVQPNSFVHINGGDESNFYPSYPTQMSQRAYKSSNSSFVKNVQSKKHSFVVMKEKINHTERKYPLKNQNGNTPHPRLRHPNGVNWLAMLSNPFEKPVAFGPPQSSHLEYSSYKPLAFDPFDLS